MIVIIFRLCYDYRVLKGKDTMNELLKLVKSDDLIQFQKQDEFLAFINKEPPTSWIKEHPIAKGVAYLPIDKVELLLKRIFQEYKVEILREGQMLNSIYVTVRLHYKHPISGWLYQDGTAAVPVKTKKGENASNMAAILNDAIQTGLPAAESFAIKDAADKIGNIFGGNLNRKDTLDFKPMYSEDEKKKQQVTMAIELLEDAENEETLREVFTGLGALMADKRVVEAKDKRKEELMKNENS